MRDFQECWMPPAAHFQVVRRNEASLARTPTRTPSHQKSLIRSVAHYFPHAFLSVAREVKGGQFKARVIKLGSESDVVTFVANPSHGLDVFLLRHNTRWIQSRRR